MKGETWTDNATSIMHVDVSRAYFHAPATSDKYVELPMEDWREGDDGHELCGTLNVSLYGTGNAASN